MNTAKLQEEEKIVRVKLISADEYFEGYKKNLETCYGRMTPTFPWIFDSLKKGEQKTDKLDITLANIRVVGFEPLGPFDARVIAGITAMGGTRGFTLLPEPETESKRQLRALLDPNGVCTEAHTLNFNFSLRELLREIGVDEGGKSIHALTDCLIRVGNIGVIIDKNRGKNKFCQNLACNFWGFRLNEETGRLELAMHPLFAKTILGGSHTRLEMDEIRAIKGATTTLLHIRLCSIIDPGKAHDFTLDTLCGYIWRNKADKSGTIRKRHFQLKKTLTELSTLPGWIVTEYAKNKYRINRPKLPKETAPISRTKRSKKALKKGSKNK
jgi:hypothetical protein